jgi:hypothetical protein
LETGCGSEVSSESTFGEGEKQRKQCSLDVIEMMQSWACGGLRSAIGFIAFGCSPPWEAHIYRHVYGVPSTLYRDNVLNMKWLIIITPLMHPLASPTKNK